MKWNVLSPRFQDLEIIEQINGEICVLNVLENSRQAA